MGSEEFQSYSQQSFSNSALCDSPNSQYPINSSQFHPQTPMSQSNSFVQSDQFPNHFTPLNLQYQRPFPLNSMNAQFPSQVQQQYGPGFSFQGLMHAPNIAFVDPTSNSSQEPKKREKTSKNPETNQSTSLCRWTTKEDVALTKARLYISCDADVGTGQKSEALWSRILQVWRENMGDYDVTRDSNALECRWSRIQTAVNKFHGYFEQLERNPESGTTPEDIKREALRMYKETNSNLPFKHEECWQLCRKNPKWCSQQLTKQGASKKQKSIVDTSLGSPPPSTQTTPGSSFAPVDVDIDPSVVTVESTISEGATRPEGRKATKDRKRKMAAEKGVIDVLGNLQCTLQRQFDFNREELELKKERDKKDYELREKILNMEIELKERNQKLKEKAQKRKEQERILEKDFTKLHPDLRKTFQRRQAQILKEWEDEGLFGDVSGSDDAEM